MTEKLLTKMLILKKIFIYVFFRNDELEDEEIHTARLSEDEDDVRALR